jgi:hypothetical protein
LITLRRIAEMSGAERTPEQWSELAAEACRALGVVPISGYWGHCCGMLVATPEASNRIADVFGVSRELFTDMYMGDGAYCACKATYGKRVEVSIVPAHECGPGMATAYRAARHQATMDVMGLRRMDPPTDIGVQMHMIVVRPEHKRSQIQQDLDALKAASEQPLLPTVPATPPQPVTFLNESGGYAHFPATAPTAPPVAAEDIPPELADPPLIAAAKRAIEDCPVPEVLDIDEAAGIVVKARDAVQTWTPAESQELVRWMFERACPVTKEGGDVSEGDFRSAVIDAETAARHPEFAILRSAIRRVSSTEGVVAEFLEREPVYSELTAEMRASVWKLYTRRIRSLNPSIENPSIWLKKEIQLAIMSAIPADE